MSLREWLTLAITCGVAIIGLLLASASSDQTIYAIGLGLFVAAIIYAFMLVKRYFDGVDQAH